MPKSNKSKGARTDQYLDLGEQRILRWLRRYPFQRAQDLVVALGPWEGRGAVYRRLGKLEDRRLIEALRLGAVSNSGGKRLYYLSFAGMQVCASWAKQQSAFPLTLQSEREKLIRLFPRLPVWLPLQDLVNGLVSAAPVVLTHGGQKARTVQWNWLRDYTHQFVTREQGERTLKLRLDGVLAFCLHFPPSLGMSPRIWHTLLLLYCPLDDLRLLRQRLDRLLRWRESTEWQSFSCQIPPVLILATNPHQVELWQTAAAQVASRLRVELPPGALTCSPEGERSVQNSWHLPWRTLGTDTPCHLQNLLPPHGSLALPELLDMHDSLEREETSGEPREADRVRPMPPLIGRHSFHLATIVAARHIPGKRHGAGPGSTKDYRLASASLVPRQWEILTLIFAHPLLSRDELSSLLNLCPKSLQILLASLRTAGYLACPETLAGWRWHLAEAGLRLLARMACCHVQRLVRVPLDSDQPLQQRGVAGLLHQARHTAGLYSFFAHLHEALAGIPGAQLRWWETGVLCERVFLYRDKTYHFKPDALASVRIGERTWSFWLEWDRGTMGVRDLERKCATYAAYLTSREWASGGMPLPALVYVVPEIAQERRLMKVARALLAHLPALRLYTTTANLILTQGILAPIWQQVVLHIQDTPPEPSQRSALFSEG